MTIKYTRLNAGDYIIKFVEDDGTESIKRINKGKDSNVIDELKSQYPDASFKETSKMDIFR